MIKNVVIPAAGLGTRLLSATKEQPKEMLPVFGAGENGVLCLKPMIQQVFEQLFDLDFRNFYFVVGREKRAIEDHFTPNRNLIERLQVHGKNRNLKTLESFYNKVESTNIVWVNQPDPNGFGDAVLRAEPLMKEDAFMVHAGDTCILSSGSFHSRLVQVHEKYGSDATLSLKEIQGPTIRMYGVADASEAEQQTLTVRAVVEKPDAPRSKLAIMPIYVFKRNIFDALRATKPGKGGEIQLTDAIQKLIERGLKVLAVKLTADEIRLDIGTPETYWDALNQTYSHAVTRARG
ncbi:MAG TPA: sugar phosphate nucleotidyltransferase [Candidatus Dormibacteraeota bacterium]|nr:sugar phosphate nucleotidyltransferase [Candidatus Dormibacteraeota bacterium]